MPTFRRPGQLEQLLRAIAAQQDAPPCALLIADNAQDREGMAAAERMRASGYPLPLDAFAVPERGLCHVRNALFARALANPRMTHVAMIDDDEWPEPGWLAALLRMQMAHGADAVGGPVVPSFPAQRPRWAGQTGLFGPIELPTGPVPMIWGAGNALVTRACLEATSAPWFDPRFNSTGGEDLDLFTRWRVAGRRFAWAPDAVANEHVPDARLRPAWVLRRLWRIGNTDATVSWKHATGRGRAAVAGRALASVAAALLGLPLALVPGARRIDHLGRPVRALGRIAGLIGHAYREYDEV